MKMKLKDLPDNTVDFMNSLKVRNYIFDKTKRPLRITLFFGNNIEKFTKLFGESNGTYTGERRSKYWIINFKDRKIIIFSGSVRGTSYEIVGSDLDEFIKTDSLGDLLVEFLTDLENKLGEKK